jgi:formamidopyrimidine-DNA glycosylase
MLGTERPQGNSRKAALGLARYDIASMPEAAEVETLRRQLEPFAPFRITAVEVTGHRSVRAHAPEELSQVVGHKILSVVREGKWLGLRGEELGARIHLRMSGRLFMGDTGSRSPHQHVTFSLEDAAGVHRQLAFIDPRTFGEVALWAGSQLGFTSVDVLDASRDNEVVERLLQGRRCLKDVLLDQRAVVQGVGNIYADEVCHALGVLPQTRCADLGRGTAELLMPTIREVIEAAAVHRGTALRDEGWSDLHGVIGGNGAHLVVHEQTRCRSCAAPVVKAKVAGRSTYWCPECQR